MALTSTFQVVHSTAADSTSEATGSIHSGPPSGQERAGADDDHRPGEVGEQVQPRGAHGDRLGTVVVADEQHAATVDDDRQETDDHHRHAVDGFRDRRRRRIDSVTIHATEPSSSSAEMKPPSASAFPRPNDHVVRGRATGDPDGDDGGDQADRVDGLVRGVGEHHHRADGHTDHDLHDGETDVDRGRAREPARDSSRRAGDRRAAWPSCWCAVLVAAVILIH